MLDAFPDFLLHTVRAVSRMGQRVRELLMPQGLVVLWTEYASGLFQQVLPTGKDKAMPAQLVKKVGEHPVVARTQRDSQLAFQKRTQDGCIKHFHKHTSLIGTIGNEAQLVIVNAAAQRQGMVLHGGGGHGYTRFLPRRSFRSVVQVQQVFQGGVIGAPTSENCTRRSFRVNRIRLRMPRFFRCSFNPAASRRSVWWWLFRKSAANSLYSFLPFTTSDWYIVTASLSREFRSLCNARPAK